MEGLCHKEEHIQKSMGAISHWMRLTFYFSPKRPMSATAFISCVEILTVVPC